MTPVEIQLESCSSLAVIFIDDVTAKLCDVRNQILEEVKELVPEQFHFLSKWGPPISRVQETKMALTEAFHTENVVKIRETLSAQGASKRKAEEVDRSESPAEESPTRDTETEDRLSSPSTSSGGNEKPPAKPSVQRTLTSFFGAKSSPTARYATAAARKGVHIYSEDDILRSTGTEKERREWWNEKAKELCEDPQNNMLRGEAIDQRLHKEWRLHKAAKMLEEEKETTKSIEEIIGKYPDLEAFLGSINTIKEQTLSKNVRRLELAIVSLTRSRDKLKELSISQLLHKDQRGMGFQQVKKEMEERRESHNLHYRELSKAQEAMSKVLSVKKNQLKELCEKSKDDTKE